MGALFSLGSVVCTISDPSSCGNWEPPGVDGKKYRFLGDFPKVGYLLSTTTYVFLRARAVLLGPPSRAAAVLFLFLFYIGGNGDSALWIIITVGSGFKLETMKGMM
jgi:hypothetical protein